MNIEDLRLYALSLPDALEDFPFGDDVIVFKVNNKIFLLLPLNVEGLRFNVKCNPEYALELREQYSCIQPGYHMNKKHWNTIFADGTLSAAQLKQFIYDSYLLVNKRK
ncbi:MAG: MmcQ/YjbR family DNA-binding protein [Ginsengibacter sp.]